MQKYHDEPKQYKGYQKSALSGAVAVVARGRLRLPPTAPRPGWTAGVAAGLVTLAISIIFHVPPAEYVMGGKDPGTYMNEGIQIAQRGTLIYADPLVMSIPPESLGLSMLEGPGERRAVRRDGATYHSRRFMGFYLLDPDQGTVLGQFPHLLPVWIAVGYGTNGLTGARYVVTTARPAARYSKILIGDQNQPSRSAGNADGVNGASPTSACAR